jgi:hypothetical protein
MKVTVQVVTIADDGQELTKEVACVEREELMPETLGLSLAEGKTLLQAIQEVVGLAAALKRKPTVALQTC